MIRAVRLVYNRVSLYTIIARTVSVRVTYDFSDFIQLGQGTRNRQFWVIIN